jgi:transcriptional regulator with XRE-family HTH domain
MPTLGERVRAARLARGLSVANFAAACGLSSATIATVEYGGRVTRASVAKIAACLGLPVSDLDPDGRVSAGAGKSRKQRLHR